MKNHKCELRIKENTKETATGTQSHDQAITSTGLSSQLGDGDCVSLLTDRQTEIKILLTAYSLPGFNLELRFLQSVNEIFRGAVQKQSIYHCVPVVIFSFQLCSRLSSRESSTNLSLSWHPCEVKSSKLKASIFNVHFQC